MFRNAMYLNVFITFIISIILTKRSFSKKSDLRRLRYLIIVYLVFNIINYSIIFSETVEIGWNSLFISPILFISIILNIISLIRIRIKCKQSDDTEYKKLSIIKIIVVTIIPVIIFLVPYVYELSLLNSCSYLLRYNYQDGMTTSENTYIAIVDNKPVTLTLTNNIFNRQGKSTEELYYEISYIDGVKFIIEDSSNNKSIEKNIKKIALDAKKRCSSAKGACIAYFPEGKYAIIELLSEEDHGALLGMYCYYDNKYMQDIDAFGDLESVTYYE